ncbi:MAG: hypothetical protein JRJ00_10965 [Deltaproteobacteria bacterium]|nr:hypothetical protein [Deltaproteobacteria bacterium]
MINKKIKITSIQLIVGLWFLALSSSLGQAEVTLTVGDGSGAPSSSDNQIAVSLENPDDVVKGVSVEICEDNDSLSCTECETTERTTGFNCTTNEIEAPDPNAGCCSVLLFSFSNDDSIEGITGPVFTLTYDVSEEATEGDCVDLTPEEVQIAGEDDELPPGEVVTESGEFCFLASSTTTTTNSSTTTTTTTTPSISISPDPMWKSRWISLPYLMVIIGNNTHFKCFNSRLSFEPPLMLFPCFPIVWDEIHIWNFIWVMPGWLSGMEDKTVTVTVTTGDEVVESDFEIAPLPFILDAERNSK